jgi:hypothetical protein
MYSYVLTNKCTIFDVTNLFLLITLLHVSMRNHHHHHQGVSFCTIVTKSIKVNSTLMCRCHNKIKRLEHHKILQIKLVTLPTVLLITIGVPYIYHSYVFSLYMKHLISHPHKTHGPVRQILCKMKQDHTKPRSKTVV